MIPNRQPIRSAITVAGIRGYAADCCSRRVTGWAIADHMRTELVEDALTAAVALRGSLDGALFNSDHGSHYTSKAFAELCRDLAVTQSMGGVGFSADNALAESFHAVGIA